MILVTGATGLVGSHLVLQLLEDGMPVRALYRNPEKLEKVKALFCLYNKEALYDKAQWFQADITEIPALEAAFTGIDYVYHCAALVSVTTSEEEQLRKINIEGTSNIVNFCIDYKVKKLCHVSSIAALGDVAVPKTPITEETEWNPNKNHGDYAISKYGAEMEVWRGDQEGLPVVIVNPGIILGPGFPDQGSGQIFSLIAAGLPYYTFGSTGFVSVEDVVKIMIQLMNSPIQGERYTLISENIVYKDLILTIADALHAKKPTIAAKPWMTSIAWRADWLLSKLFFRERKLSRSAAKSSHTADIFSNEKIIKALDYQFEDIKTYIKKMAVYYT